MHLEEAASPDSRGDERSFISRDFETESLESRESFGAPPLPREKPERWSCREFCGDGKALSAVGKPLLRFSVALKWLGALGGSASSKASDWWFPAKEIEENGESSKESPADPFLGNTGVDDKRRQASSVDQAVPTPATIAATEASIAQANSFITGGSSENDAPNSGNLVTKDATTIPPACGSRGCPIPGPSKPWVPHSVSHPLSLGRRSDATAAGLSESLETSTAAPEEESARTNTVGEGVGLPTDSSRDNVIKCWMECCHPRAVLYFGSKKAVEIILDLLRQGVEATGDPVVGDETKCVMWQGEFSSDGHPVLDINKPSAGDASVSTTSRVFVNRLVCYLFASGDSFADLVDALPQDVPLSMACRNKSCVAVTHVSIDALPSDDDRDSDTEGSSVSERSNNIWKANNEQD